MTAIRALSPDVGDKMLIRREINAGMKDAARTAAGITNDQATDAWYAMLAAAEGKP